MLLRPLARPSLYIRSCKKENAEFVLIYFVRSYAAFREAAAAERRRKAVFREAAYAAFREAAPAERRRKAVFREAAYAAFREAAAAARRRADGGLSPVTSNPWMPVGERGQAGRSRTSRSGTRAVRRGMTVIGRGPRRRSGDPSVAFQTEQHI